MLTLSFCRIWTPDIEQQVQGESIKESQIKGKIEGLVVMALGKQEI